MCSARAPIRVAIASALRAGTAVGIAADTLGQQRRQPHFLEHVEIVVRRGAVGADADVEPELQHAARRARCRRRASGCSSDCGRRPRRILQRPHLAVVHVHAVRGKHLGAEQSLLLDPRDHRHAVHPPRVFDLLSSVSDEVGVQRHVELRRELGAGAQDLRRAGVRRVRRRDRARSAGGPPALDEVARARETRLRSWPRPARESAAPSARRSARMPASAVASATASSK